MIGELVYVAALGQSVLVLNSSQAISDLLEKRGNIYSHRPRFVMAGELMGLDKVRVGRGWFQRH